MKKNMPLEGLRWSRDSGSALYDTPQTAVLGRAGGPAMESLGTEARRGLEGGYEPCAPFLTRQERGLEGGLERGLDGHALKGGKAL